MLALPRIAGLLCVGCLLAAGVLYWLDQPPEPQPPFFVEPLVFELPDADPGAREVVVRFTNTGTVARRIIGLEEG